MSSDDRSVRSAILAVLRKVISVKELHHSWSRENNFAPTELADLKLGYDGSELLKRMLKDGLLTESSTTTILSCPSCGKSDYVAILRCVKCGQSAIRKEHLLQHKAGGHTYLESAFRRGGDYVCPSCSRTLTPQDYMVVGFWFVCEKCGEKQPSPKIEFRCLDDGTIFTEATSTIRRLSDYKVTEKGVAQLEYDKYRLIDEVIMIVQQSGMNVVREVSSTGASGIKHVFDLSVSCEEGGDIKVDVVYSKDIIDGRDVLASYAKLVDTSVQRYVLVAWPKLSEEAKMMVKYYKMNVIEASTLEELERAFTKLLASRKEGCCSDLHQTASISE